MYIEFRLPSGAGGAAAGHAAYLIKKEVAEWAEKHQVPYRTKAHKYTLRVILESEQAYTHFQLSWDSKSYSGNRYSIVHPES
jgi:hypothetical protein